MRNLRKVVALVLAFTLVLSMGSVSFAAEKTAAEKAETLGVLMGEGSGVTADYLAKTPSRLQAAIISLRLRGLEADAKAYEGTEKFADQDDILWAEGKNIAAYLKANPELGWVGTGDDMLKPNEPISAQAYVKVMLEALGYMQGTDFEWADVFTFAASKGLKGLTAETKMTNDALATGSVEALAATNKAGKVLIDKLVADGAIDKAKAEEAGLVAVNQDFAFVSAESFGLRAIKVTFTGAVDKVTSIDSEDAKGSVTAVVVEDTVVFKFSETQDQNKEVKIKFDVKGKDGIEIKDKEIKVVVADKEDPELVSVVAENAKTIKVTYNEPVNYVDGVSKVFDKVKIDDAKLVGQADLSDDMTTITYTLQTKLAANSYTFTMEAVKDFAGFQAPSESKTITVVADDAAPVLVEVKVVDKNNIKLVFDENVKSIGDVKINGKKATVTTPDGKSKEVKVALPEALDAADAFVAVKGTYTNVKDVVENASTKDKEIEFSFKAPSDQTGPTATVEPKTVDGKTTLKIKFSEKVMHKSGVSITNATISSIIKVEKIVADGDDKDVTASVSAIKYISSDEYYRVEFKSDLDVSDAIDLKVTLKSEIIDGSVIGNKFAETSYTIKTPDNKRPTIEGNVTIVGENKIRVAFSEAMDVASLQDLGNFIYTTGSTINTLSVITDAKAEVASNGKSVDLTIPTMKGVTSASVALGSLRVLNVKDVAGKLLDTNDYNDLKTIQGPAAFTQTNVTFTAVAVDTIEMVSDRVIKVVDVNEFKVIEESGVNKTRYITNATLSSDGKKVTLKLNKDLETDLTTAAASTVAVKVAVVGDDTVDIYGAKLNVTGSGIVASRNTIDKIAPTVKAEVSGSGIKLTFSEAITTGSNTLMDDVVVAKGSSNVTLTMGSGTTAGTINTVTAGKVYFINLDAKKEHTVQVFSRYIKDASGNTTKGLAATKLTTK